MSRYPSNGGTRRSTGSNNYSSSSSRNYSGGGGDRDSYRGSQYSSTNGGGGNNYYSSSRSKNDQGGVADAGGYKYLSEDWIQKTRATVAVDPYGSVGGRGVSNPVYDNNPSPYGYGNSSSRDYSSAASANPYSHMSSSYATALPKAYARPEDVYGNSALGSSALSGYGGSSSGGFNLGGSGYPMGIGGGMAEQAASIYDQALQKRDEWAAPMHHHHSGGGGGGGGGGMDFGGRRGGSSMERRREPERDRHRSPPRRDRDRSDSRDMRRPMASSAVPMSRAPMRERERERDRAPPPRRGDIRRPGAPDSRRGMMAPPSGRYDNGRGRGLSARGPPMRDARDAVGERRAREAESASKKLEREERELERKMLKIQRELEQLDSGERKPAASRPSPRPRAPLPTRRPAPAFSRAPPPRMPASRPAMRPRGRMQPSMALPSLMDAFVPLPPSVMSSYGGHGHGPQVRRPVSGWAPLTRRGIVPMRRGGDLTSSYARGRRVAPAPSRRDKPPVQNVDSKTKVRRAREEQKRREEQKKREEEKKKRKKEEEIALEIVDAVGEEEEEVDEEAVRKALVLPRQARALSIVDHDAVHAQTLETLESKTDGETCDEEYELNLWSEDEIEQMEIVPIVIKPDISLKADIAAAILAAKDTVVSEDDKENTVVADENTVADEGKSIDNGEKEENEEGEEEGSDVKKEDEVASATTDVDMAEAKDE